MSDVMLETGPKSLVNCGIVEGFAPYNRGGSYKMKFVPSTVKPYFPVF